MTLTITPDNRLRLLGFLPLMFFVAQGVHYWRIGELGNMLWLCNIGNLLLAIGLFLRRPVLIRVAVIWTVPGLLVWLVYVVPVWGVLASSALAHVGGLVVGLFALTKVRTNRSAWLYAFVWYLAIQLLSRLLASREMNVNLSHRLQPGWEKVFGTYWQFWLTLSVTTALILWMVGLVLWKLWPVRMSDDAVWKE